MLLLILFFLSDWHMRLLCLYWVKVLFSGLHFLVKVIIVKILFLRENISRKILLEGCNVNYQGKKYKKTGILLFLWI